MTLSDVYSSTKFAHQELLDFFAKPYLFYNGTITNTDGPLFTPTFVLPHDTLRASDAHLSKLRGFYGFKATAVFTLQINATRFQQGRYMITSTPIGGNNLTNLTETAKLYRMANSTLVQRTTLPHVEFDLNNDSQAVLKVPYVSQFYTVPISAILATGNYYGATHYITVTPYSALQAVSGALDASYSLWVHYEDVEVDGPAVFQSGVQFKEMKNNKLGPISSVTTKISKSAKILEKVPLLSNFAGPVSWVSDIATDVAKIWGWSKPNNISTTTKVQRQILSNFGTLDGPVVAEPLALISDHLMEVMPGFAGSSVDEMAFSNIVKKPAWFKTQAWSTTDAIGSAIYTASISPGTFATTTTYGTDTVYHFTPLAFVDSLFTYWRGSIVLRLKFVKTEFHTGRLLIVYDTGTANLGTYSNSITAPRTIVDIRESTSVDIVIPFISEHQYLDGTAGILKIYVLDALKAPTTVSSTINILMEAYAGDDLEFLAPATAEYLTPVVPLGLQSGWGDTELPKNVIGGGEITITDAHVRAAGGERVNSFRQMLKQYKQIVLGPATSTFTASIITMDAGVYDIVNSLVSSVDQPYIAGTLYGALLSSFALYRGGLNLIDLPLGTDYTWAVRRSDPYSGSYIFSSSGAGVLNTDTAFTNFPLALWNSSISKHISVNIPYYGFNHAGSTYNLARGKDRSWGPNYSIKIQALTADASVAVNHVLFRAVADDFSLGCFRSFPGMCKRPPQNQP